MLHIVLAVILGAALLTIVVSFLSHTIYKPKDISSTPASQAIELHSNTNICCLLIHGFPGSPNDLRALSLHLSSNKISAIAPRIAGFGTNPSNLLDTSYTDWISSIETEYERLALRYKKVYLIGFSMGSLIAIQLAIRNDAAGIILINPALVPKIKLAFHINNIPLKWISPRLIKYVPTGSILKDNIHDNEGSYSIVPLSACEELISLAENTSGILANINTPTRVFVTRNDLVVDTIGANIIIDQIASQDKKLVQLNEEGHTLKSAESIDTITKGLLDIL